MAESLRNLGLDVQTSEHRLLVTEAWDMVNTVVFDLWNHTYDFANAHHPQDLPVIFIQYGRKGPVTSLAGRPHRNMINQGVARHHNNNGWVDKPPFFEDHTEKKIPCYYNPRDMVFSRRNNQDNQLCGQQQP